jgi:O-succinylbenzoic acid--CoA ligase
MDVVTPVDWIDAHATVDYDRPALLFADGSVTYGQLRDEVHRRTTSLRGEAAERHVIPVPVELDLPSIVEVLALQNVGACPLPYVSKPPNLTITATPVSGAVIAVTTSGTTGQPNIVPLTMGNLSASVAASKRRLSTSQHDRWLLSLSINHIGGLSVLFRMFEAGGEVVVSPFGEQLGEVIQRSQPTVASFVPTMVHRLLASSSNALASIGTILVGGARLDAAVADQAAGLGITVVPTYGMTETSSQIATAVPGDPFGGQGYVGKPLDGFAVDIDTTGRIVVDGPAVFAGYLGETQRTGGFRTNDLGSLDDAGGLTIAGRADDVAVIGGENVSVAHVESQIRGIEGVRNVHVVGVPDIEWGTILCAMVVSDVDMQEIKEQLSGHLGPHEIPKRWITADSIPLLPNKKPDTATIRKAWLG